jgi:hypothetical protein
MPNPSKIEIALLAAIAAMGLGACGDRPVDPTIAKAVTIENKTEQAQKRLAELDKKEAAEKRRAEEERKAKLEAELDAAAQLPSQMPATLDAACDALLTSYDDFMRRGSEKEAIEYYQTGRRKHLAIVRRDKCELPQNLPASACASVALMQPLETLADLERTKAANMVLERCSEKFAKG